MHKNKTPIHPTCPTCGTPASRLLEPTTYTHPNGRVQRMQEAYCHRCHESFRTLKRYGLLPATLPISLRESKPEPRCPDCNRRVANEGNRCVECARIASIIRPQDTGEAKYRLRYRKAPGLTTSQVRKLLRKWVHQRRTCAYCPEPATTVDHVIPLSRGGDNREGNLTPACQPCNSSKQAALLIEWRNGRRPKRTRTQRRPAPPKPPKPPKPEKEPVIKPTCITCGTTTGRPNGLCRWCDPEEARKRRINARNRYRAKIGMPPSDADYIFRNRSDKARSLGSGGGQDTEPCSTLSLSESRENPFPFEGPASVWQCPGCGFVIGIDECCDCR